MELGLFTCGYQRTSVRNAFVDARAFGYDYVELWGGRPHAYGPDLVRRCSPQLDEIRSAILEYDMPVRIYTPEHNAYPFNYMMGDMQIWQDCMDYLKCCMEAAARLGACAMLVSVGHSGNASQQMRFERLLQSLDVLCAEAKAQGLTLLLEPLTRYESDACVTLDELVRVLEAADYENLLGMCDLVVPFTNGEDPAEYAHRLGEKMGHLHLADSDGSSDLHLLPGEGRIDFPETLKQLCEAGYDGTATIELVTHYIDAPGAAAAEAIRRIRQAMPGNSVL